MRQFVAILNASLLTFCVIVCFGVQAAANDAHQCCRRGKDKPNHCPDGSAASCAMKAMEPSKHFDFTPEIVAADTLPAPLFPATSRVFRIAPISQAPPDDLSILNRVLRL